MENGYVYIARAKNGDVKVGKSINYRARMKNHENTSRGGIKLVAVIKADNYSHLETFIHNKLKGLGLEIWNEWYKNEELVLRTIIDFMKGHGEIFGAYEIYFTSPKSQAG